MERTVEVHAYHGWGMNGDFWAPLISVLPDHVFLKPADRGYFGGEFEPEFSEKAQSKVLFLHSYGVHWCPIEKLEQADTIVILNGFDSFHPLTNPAKSRSKKILKGMQSGFKANPDRVLETFYKNCFDGKEFEMPNLSWKNRSLLSKDLAALHKTKLKLNKRTVANWIIIDSTSDRIVPGARGVELVSLTGSDKYYSMKGSDHAFPVSNPQECTMILSKALPIFEAK